jgi:hypothetical protein
VVKVQRLSTDDPGAAPAAAMTNHKPDDLDRRRDEIVADLSARIAGVSGGGGLGARGGPLRLSRVRLRTLLLPAFALGLMLYFGEGGAAPLGVEAAFEPGSGGAFAGFVEVKPKDRTSGAGSPTPADAGAPSAAIPVEPGDMVGTTDGSPGTLTLGRGRLELHAGSRALLESVVPPRVRLISGTAVARGQLRVLTPHGLLDLQEGELWLGISPEGLRLTLRSGEASLVSPDGAGPLLVGEERLVR